MQANSNFPIEIIHIDLDHSVATDFKVTTENIFFVFWMNKIPVGQAFASACADGSLNIEEIARTSVLSEALETARKPFSYGSPMKVTVVICTRDRPDELERCLASFSTQTRHPDQILVVDNASKDDRTMMAANRAGVDYVREDRPGLDFARNTGAIAAKGDLVVYTDDDVVITPNWLERLIMAFDDDDVMAVTGLVLPAELETEAQYIFEKDWSFGRGYMRIDFGEAFFNRHRKQGCPAWEVGAGANMAFRKQIFDEIGLFDERLDVGAAGCSGDSEYWYRILAAGWRCRYEPSAVVFHYHRRTFEGLANQLQAYMRGHVTALFVQFERTREYGNLRRAFVSLPVYYVHRCIRRLLHGSDFSNQFLFQEIKGYLAGFLYYAASKKIVLPSLRAR